VESDGIRSRHIANGCIRTEGDDLPARLGEIFQGIRQVVREYHPVEAAVEQVFMAKNAQSALKLGQARGAAICAVVGEGVPVSEYPARLVKQSVVGNGGADKAQVEHMVKILLRLDEALAADAADALAVALSHAHAGRVQTQLARWAGVRR
jgi:crossover junction endodeoxyribonuclease RuvC